MKFEKIFDGKWIKVFNIAYERLGKTYNWVFASRSDNPGVPRGPDAIVLIVNYNGKLLITREMRPPLWDGKDCWEYGFPAGLVEAGESIEDAAKRELKEETGLDIVEISDASPMLYSSAGLTDERVQLIFCKASGTVTRDLQEDGENIEVLFYNSDQLDELVSDQSKKFSGKAWPFMLLVALTKVFTPVDWRNFLNRG